MATSQAVRTDTIFLLVDNTELKLSVTTRAPIHGQANPPSPSQLARIRTGLVMQYAINFRKAVSGEWQLDDFDKDLKSPIRVVAEDEKTIIEPSLHDPYVTVWAMGDWVKPQVPSLTIHDWDDGNEIRSLSAICEASNDRLREIFNTGNGVKGIQLLYISSFKRFQHTEHDNTVNPPTLDNTNRIGRNADNLPDTQQRKPTQQSEGAYFHAVNAVVRQTKKGKFAESISLESFERNKQNFKTQAQIANQPYDSKAVQYDHALLVAYSITGFAKVGEWNGQRFVDIPLGDKNFRQYYQERSANQEFPTNWENLVTNLGMADESLTVGLKIEIPADYLVLKTDSEKDGLPRVDKDNKPVQYKNFYRFYRKENSSKAQAKTQSARPHDDLDTYFGENRITHSAKDEFTSHNVDHNNIPF